MSTCWSWIRSPMTGGRSAASDICERDAVPSELGTDEGQHVGDDCAIEPAGRRATAERASRARIRVSTSAARLPSSTMAASAARTWSRGGRVGAQPVEAGAGVGDDGGQGLVDLVRDRGGQLAQGRHAGDVRELGLGSVQGVLGLLALGDVVVRLEDRRGRAWSPRAARTSGWPPRPSSRRAACG